MRKPKEGFVLVFSGSFLSFSDTSFPRLYLLNKQLSPGRQQAQGDGDRGKGQGSCWRVPVASARGLRLVVPGAERLWVLQALEPGWDVPSPRGSEQSAARPRLPCLEGPPWLAAPQSPPLPRARTDTVGRDGGSACQPCGDTAPAHRHRGGGHPPAQTPPGCLGQQQLPREGSRSLRETEIGAQHPL